VTLVLIGPPAAGKTRVGKRLATRLGLEFIDTDRLIVAEHGAIASIFAKHGEPYFRTLERDAVAEALTSSAVVSLGGGAVLNTETQADLAGRTVVLLTTTAEAAATRILNTKRPLIDGIEAWKRLNESRAELYASLADFTIDTSARPVESIVEAIASWVKGPR
jgi:shikimate kinase